MNEIEIENNRQGYLEKLGKRYVNNPTIRILLQLIPHGIGSAIDVAFTTKINNLREARFRAFFDELSNQNTILTKEMIANSDFLHAYYSTLKAALNTRRKEKIRLFARLFSNYYNDECFENPDDYEEALSIIDDLSYREFQILLIINKHEKSNPKKEDQNTLQRIIAYWNDLLKDIEVITGIPNNEINSNLTRLNRTGLYQTLTPVYWDYEGDVGHLTKYFEKFIKVLNIDDSFIE